MFTRNRPRTTERQRRSPASSTRGQRLPTGREAGLLLPRRGFTMTEMLVSVAVVMLIMAIISEAFVAGMESFRQFKAIGDLDSRLRAATILLRRDLQADHFNAPPARLSSYSTAPPPAEGYVYIATPAPGSVPEGADADAVFSYHATNHWLAFTVNWSKAGAQEDPHLMRLENYLSASVPGTPLAALSPPQFNDSVNFLSQSAEVAYFLTATGQSTTGPSPQPLFKLHRRQRLLLPASDAATMNAQNVAPGELPKYYDVAAKVEGTAIHFHTLAEAADPAERTLVVGAPAAPPAPLGGTSAGADVILYDVLSFTVRIMRPGDADFMDVPGGVYDTATASETISAIEITLRVWDVKTNTTRQITIVQDM